MKTLGQPGEIARADAGNKRYLAQKPGRWVRLLLAFVLVTQLPAAAAPGPSPSPVKLKPQTVEAYERYVRLTAARHEDELKRSDAVLRVDAQPDAQRQATYARLRKGEVVIEKLRTLEDGKPIEAPSGLIHHWVGVIFIPGATLEQTLALVKDYDHHSTYYQPDVMRSKILAHDGDDFKVYLRFRKKKVITVVLDTDHHVHYFPADATRAHSRSSTTRIAQVDNAGKPDEHQKPIGDDGGYLWRMDTWWRFLERDAGTYVQCESVSLTRDIPAIVDWLVRGFVESIPRESLAFTLGATRAALLRKPAAFDAK